MAKFLTTNGNSLFIEELMKEATDSLTLVTPYLKLTDNFLQRLKDVDSEGIKITLIYGKTPMHQNEKASLMKLNNLEIYYYHNLHAKCYHNEKKLIITSMNLYEFSEKNNREMGVLFDSKEDDAIFKEALKEIKSIINASLKEKEIISGNKNSIIAKAENQNKIEAKEHEEDPTINSTKQIIKSSKDSKNNSTDKKKIYKTDLKFSTPSNFYFPALAERLTEVYPLYWTEYNKDSLTINLLKGKKIEIEITGRLDFIFKNSSYYETFKEKNQKKINQQLNPFRVYWNYNVINIYTPKDYEYKTNQKELEIIVEKFFSAIVLIDELVYKN